jgi:CubicO group peptidase (beta-lactamase class C family)
MDALFPHITVEASDTPWELPRREGRLPETFRWEGQEMDVGEFLDATMTTGLLVIHDDAIVHESYYRGHSETTRHISWSVAKSFTSALVGIAIEQGRIGGVMDPVTKYRPDLAGSGYDGVPLKHVLQMSSGVKFNEDYADFWSDINRMGRVLALNRSIDEFVASLEREHEPGTYNHYVSMDTQVLGMVLHAAVGGDVAQYFEEVLWKPMGAEADMYWLTDMPGMPLVFMGLNAVLRDYGRFGLLYLHHGRRGDQQIVPEAWVEASITPDAPHLMPGLNSASTTTDGYGYQWWIPETPEDDFFACGVYNQWIYVNRRHNVVIAKHSANARYLVDDMISEPQSIAFFKAVAVHVDSAAP